MQLYDITTTSRRVRETRARFDKIRYLAACLRQVEPAEIEIAVALLSGETRQGRIGLGPATLQAALPPHSASRPELTLTEVDATLKTSRIFCCEQRWASCARVRLKG